MAEAYIIDAVRTPVGKRGGGLSRVHSADLGAHVISALMARTGVDPGAVEDVIFGCCDTIGSQAGDIARTCWLAAGLPQHVPGVTIDRQCGSSQQSVHFAAQGVLSGTSDLIVAGGVQNMSMIPISSAMTCAESLGFKDPFSGSTGWVERYGPGEVSQFRGADRDLRHVLHAAGDDEVRRAGHHRLRREVQRLLRRPALPVDGHAGDGVG